MRITCHNITAYKKDYIVVLELLLYLTIIGLNGDGSGVLLIINILKRLSRALL